MTSPELIVYFDVTQTLKSNFTTGIQRVVIEWAKANAKLRENGAFSFRLVFFDDEVSCFRSLTDFDFFSILEEQQSKFVKPRSRLLSFAYWIRPLITNLFPSQVFEYIKVKLFDRIFSSYFLKGILLNSKIVTFEQNNILFTADSFWNNEKQSKYISEFVPANSLIIFVHDLLPLTHAQFFEKRSVLVFKRNFSPLLFKASLIICATQHLYDELISLGIDQTRVRRIALGTTFVPMPDNSSRVNVKASPPYRILAVGTIEPRKNYLIILKWLESTELDVKLRIVGRVGWKSKKVVHRIKRISSASAKKDRLSWHSRVPDFELEGHYQWAHFGICASFAEGYGLPLREFLNRGIPVASSSIPAFQEIDDQSLVRYFSPVDTMELEQAIRELMSIQSASKTLTTSWDDSAKSLCDLLMSHVNQKSKEGS
jgi:glycosyltransferase involved in cell wall biosynthesis